MLGINQVCAVLGTEHKALCMLGKHVANFVISLAPQCNFAQVHLKSVSGTVWKRQWTDTEGRPSVQVVASGCTSHQCLDSPRTHSPATAPCRNPQPSSSHGRQEEENQGAPLLQMNPYTPMEIRHCFLPLGIRKPKATRGTCNSENPNFPKPLSRETRKRTPR